MSHPQPPSLLTAHDSYLFNEGSLFRLYDKLGAHVVTINGVSGTSFAVWAPDAAEVSVIGEFNGWNKASHRLAPKADTGIWEGFFPGVGTGALYKYHIASRFQAYRVDKADPLSLFNEIPPKTASIVWDLDFAWSDRQWMATRHQMNRLDKPMAIYEMHLGSWRRNLIEANRSLSYRELAPELADYLDRLGYTHVEFLPVMDHPFFGSWGYQITGYFAPSGNFGTPQDFMFLIEFAQRREWAHDGSLDWDLLDYPAHAGVQRWLGDLNRFYRAEPALHELDCEPAGFEWIECGDAESSVVSLMRKGKSTATLVLAVCNFTPVPRAGYRIGAPRGGFWREALNSDAKDYGGSGVGNGGGVEATAAEQHGRPFSLTLTLPPLSVLFFANQA